MKIFTVLFSFIFFLLSHRGGAARAELILEKGPSIPQELVLLIESLPRDRFEETQKLLQKLSQGLYRFEKPVYRLFFLKSEIHKLILEFSFNYPAASLSWDQDMLNKLRGRNTDLSQNLDSFGHWLYSALLKDAELYQTLPPDAQKKQLLSPYLALFLNTPAFEINQVLFQLKAFILQQLLLAGETLAQLQAPGPSQENLFQLQAPPPQTSPAPPLSQSPSSDSPSLEQTKPWTPKPGQKFSDQLQKPDHNAPVPIYQPDPNYQPPSLLPTPADDW